jgi:hypothetical protein
MNINIIGLPVSSISVGDELAIFDGETCVGAVTLMPHHLQSQTVSIVASSADNQGMIGFKEGDPFVLKLWNSKQNTELTLDPQILKGSSTFTKNETTFASLGKYATTGLGVISGSNIALINCYPNPFSDEVNIEINLAKDAQVQVEVFNQLGQRINFLLKKQLISSGVHRLIWNGQNANNQQVSQGIYHLMINVDGKDIHKKIVYSK